MGACRDYRPDHNGECLNCDEWYDAHIEATAMTDEQCRVVRELFAQRISTQLDHYAQKVAKQTLRKVLADLREGHT